LEDGIHLDASGRRADGLPLIAALDPNASVVGVGFAASGPRIARIDG